MLDYSYYDPISVTLASPVDSIQLTDCLKSISWGLQSHEPNTAMLYSGSISFALSAAAEARGLTTGDFNEQVRPSLWMPGTAVLSVSLGGTTLKFRITELQFDYLTKSGSANITQQLAMYSVGIPDADKAFPQWPYEASVASIPYRAVTVTNNWANDKIAIGIVAPYPGISGSSTVYGQMSSSNLWAESQSLLTHTWAWLTQSLQDEKVNVLHLDYEKAPVVLTRPSSLCQVQSDRSLTFRAPRIIAHGSADLPASDQCGGEGEESENGYPPKEYTEVESELGIIMPDVYADNGGAIKVVSESKLIEYTYKTPGRTSVYNGPGGAYSQVLSWVPEEEPTMNEQSQLWKTVTINSKCLGVLFPDKYPGITTLWPYERIAETYLNRVTYQSQGLVDPEKYADIPLPLIQVKHEKLKDMPKDKRCIKTVTGGHVSTDYVRPAPVRKVEKPLTTQSFKAEASLAQQYRPALDFPLVFDIGWCPSAGFADLVAQRVLIREKIRATTDSIQMPLPRELIRAHCPVFFRLAIGSKLYFADAPQYKLEVDAQGRVKAGVSMVGCVLGSVPLIREPVPPALFYGTADLAAAELAKYSQVIYATVGVPL